MKQINIYEFNELSESAKNKAISQLRYINVNDEYWYENIFNEFMETCYKNGFNVRFKEIQFSGFSYQGDGASFTTFDIDIKKFIEENKIKFKHNILLSLFTEYVTNWEIKRINYHYSHKYTVACQCENNFYSEKYKRINNYIEEMTKIIIDKVENKKNELCDELYSKLNEEYDYLLSDEAVTDIIEANEFYFFENGKLA